MKNVSLFQKTVLLGLSKRHIFQGNNPLLSVSGEKGFLIFLRKEERTLPVWAGKPAS